MPRCLSSVTGLAAATSSAGADPHVQHAVDRREVAEPLAVGADAGRACSGLPNSIVRGDERRSVCRLGFRRLESEFLLFWLRDNPRLHTAELDFLSFRRGFASRCGLAFNGIRPPRSARAARGRRRVR